MRMNREDYKLELKVERINFISMNLNNRELNYNAHGSKKGLSNKENKKENKEQFSGEIEKANNKMQNTNQNNISNTNQANINKENKQTRTMEDEIEILTKRLENELAVQKFLNEVNMTSGTNITIQDIEKTAKNRRKLTHPEETINLNQDNTMDRQ